MCNRLNTTKFNKNHFVTARTNTWCVNKIDALASILLLKQICGFEKCKIKNTLYRRCLLKKEKWYWKNIASFFVLNYKGFTEKEIAHKLGLTQQAVNHRKMTILKKMRNSLKDFR